MQANLATSVPAPANAIIQFFLRRCPPPPGHRGANLAYRGGCNFLSTCRDGCFPPTPPPVYMPGELFHSKPPMLYMPGELFPSDPPPDLHAGGAVSFSAPPDLHAGRAVSLRPAPPIYMPCGLFLLFPLFLLLRTLEYLYICISIILALLLILGLNSY